MQPDWFAQLTGFRETSYDATSRQLVIEERTEPLHMRALPNPKPRTRPVNAIREEFCPT